jgi:hypothetical protein
MRRKNHYVPEVYLKNFADANGKLWAYRLLVEHSNVPEWRTHSPAGIAYHSHLYTRLATGAESDEIEQWFEREFETPAEEALDRAINDERLSPAHWRVLISFAAAQDVRTPARLLERLPEWQRTIQPLLTDVLEGAVQKLEVAKRTGAPMQPGPADSNSELLPIRLRQHPLPGTGMTGLRLEAVVGRRMWLYMLKHLLTKTAQVLLEHRWTIVRPFGDLRWFTSDDPVIRLDYNGPSDYNLGGGWGWTGSEILLPLSPTHMLYTQVGKRPPSRGWAFPERETMILRHIIAKHAHRMIIASAPAADIMESCARAVDSQAVRSEREQWERWHDEQTRAEQDLMSG